MQGAVFYIPILTLYRWRRFYTISMRTDSAGRMNQMFIFSRKLKLFPEGEPGAGQTDPAPSTPPASTGKTFSEDYVHDLRNEAAGHRTQNKTYEAALRKALGVADGEELGDIDKRISSREQAQQTALANALKQANDRLIEAAISSKEGYDKKLLSKVIDRSKLKVKDDLTIDGLDDAIKSAEEEFPAVKANAAPPFAAGTGTMPIGNKYTPEEAAIRAAMGLKID